MGLLGYASVERVTGWTDNCGAVAVNKMHAAPSRALTNLVM